MSQLRTRLVGAALAAVLVSTLLSGAATAAPTLPSGVDGATVPTLQWHDCGDGFECTTAQVPLDYDQPQGRSIQLALLRLPATDRQHRIGSLFINPGGPGSAAVPFLRSIGRTLYPAAVRARFDIVGMDPRGVGDSTPVQCYDTTEESAQAAILLKTAPDDPGQLAQRVAAARDFATRCAQRNGDLLDHLSTANVARDLDLMRQAVGDRQLTYDGISYGTYLGTTYAALFPGNVRAMVLDGNLDAPAYRSGGSTPFLRSHGADGGWSTLQEFLALCASAGSARCAFATGGDPARKFDALAARVRQQPIVLPGGDVVEYGTLLAATFRGLFFAHEWSTTAQLLQGIYAAGLGDAARPSTSSSVAADAVAYDNTQEAQLASVCGETSNPNQPALYPAIAQRAERRTPYAGTWLTYFTFGCTFWPARDADRYTGSFHSRTAYPALVMNTRYDPITPPGNAVAVQRLLVGSRVLNVEGYGHTVLLNSGPCDTGYRERYLIDRTLPAPGATCAAGVGPFSSPG
jgi:pimeloyl-ACP methyl ester carboxylesterase